MIKIMQVLTDTNIGGAGIWLLNFLKSCNRQELEVFVALPPNAALAGKIKELGAEITEIDGIEDKSFSISAIKNFAKAIKDKKPDIIHTHASLSARIAAKLCGVPVVHTRHCLEDKKNFPKNIIYKFINNALSAHVIGVSRAVTENLKEDGIKKDKLSLVYNGITPLRCYTPEEKLAARQSFGIGKDDISIGIVARLEEVKNPLLFAEAAKIVAKKVPEAFFLIVGEGSLRHEMENAMAPISDRACITGYLSDVEKAYNAMDMLTLTSTKEALSISLIEGQSIELPVISTDSGGPSEIITQGKNGLITPNGDADALAEAIIQLINNPELRETFGKCGSEIIRQKFTSDRMSQTIEQIYKKLAGGQIR